MIKFNIQCPCKTTRLLPFIEKRMSDFDEIKDEFMLEDSILAAPVVTPNTYSRKVVLPRGKWIADDGTKYDGNAEYVIECPIDRLIWFRKEKS